ncbi:MAG: hypothetical protein FJW26_20555 [Acidimicrobiia bacterium]|nr:hypothetical protein [Acidimicrobiia bacterium]
MKGAKYFPEAINGPVIAMILRLCETACQEIAASLRFALALGRQANLFSSVEDGLAELAARDGTSMSAHFKPQEEVAVRVFPREVS